MRPAAAVLFALLLAACGASTFANLPKEVGGMSTDVPARPATQLAYPAVHDMPPPRTRAVLTEDELKQAEAELTAARDRQPKPAGNKARDQKSQDK